MARTRYWADKFGLKYVDSVSAGQGVQATDGSTAMSAIIAKHSNVTAVFAFTDVVAQGAAVVQKTRAGGHILVVGQAGETAAIQLIKQGTMFATCADRYPEIGKQLAIAAYNAQNHVTMPKQIAVPSYEVTKANA